ncbi:MAG TPA: carboxypeptidase regulatory-like domain-containing protein [Sphingobacteriaceae bacterium]
MKYGFLLLLQLVWIRALAQDLTQFTGTVHDHKRKPLPDVTVRVLYSGETARTDSGGRFSLALRSRQVRIAFSRAGYRSDTLTVDRSETASVEVRLFPEERVLGEVKVSGAEDARLVALTRARLPSVSGNFESLLKTLPGVSPNNELTSRYAVRGGNFDENLLYVNDVEIYQPFLVRNGQQEGLSFVNPELAGSARFSAGGFEARYGDKMSSVLDVTYLKPDSSELAFSGGMPGSSITVRHPARDGRSFLLAGIRHKANRAVLGTQETRGNYQPRFYDLQVLYDRGLGRKWGVSYLGSYNSSRFRLVPEDRESEFGTSSEVYRLEVQFNGREELRYQTLMNALTLRYRPSGHVQLKWIQSAFRTDEKEATNLQSRYLFGSAAGSEGPEGVGSQLRQRSASMESAIYASELKAYVQHPGGFLQAGLKYQYERIRDRFTDDLLIDSAANTVPYTPAFSLAEHSFADHTLGRARWSSYLQNAVSLGNGLRVTGGIRTSYTTAGSEWIVSPRFQLSYSPPGHPGSVYRFAAGRYAQPHFYRELRFADGTLAAGLPAQRSVHLITGVDREFPRFRRPVKLSGELYYKRLSRLVPYKVEDLQITYLPGHSAHGYAAGADLTLSGELVPDLESVFRLSLMKSAEDIDGDFYMKQGPDGQLFRYEPGYLKRPTDQRVSMAVVFQDRLFSDPAYKVHLTMLYGGALPIGPPGQERYADRFRIPAYRRADIGFSRDWSPDGWLKRANLRSLVVYAGVFNLFGHRNTVSYLWIRDINQNQFAVPNYLTGRMLHVRIIGQIRGS